MSELKVTPLYDFHKTLGVKFTNFADYNMPLNFTNNITNDKALTNLTNFSDNQTSFFQGTTEEHKWVRNNCGFFDVSHMGQLFITGEADILEKFLSTITPTDFSVVKNGEAKYTCLLNDNGGIVDDLIISRLNEKKFFIVINAGCKKVDIEFIKDSIKKYSLNLNVNTLLNRILVAIQGPKAQEVMQDVLQYDTNVTQLKFMNLVELSDNHIVSRTGYTGEDGFEISLEASKIDEENLYDKLVAKPEILRPVGFVARDSLRSEMGYPLYGNDLNENITPLEAGLGWIISKTNSDRTYNGKDVIQKQKQQGITQKRVGIKLLDKGMLRVNMEIFSENDTENIGTICSSNHSPELNASIGQAYIKKQFAKSDTKVLIKVKDNMKQAVVCKMPFITKK